MKRLYLVLSFLLLSWILVFAFKKPPSSLPGEENYKAQQDDFPKLTGPYLGQKPPGMTPEIFAPGIVSLGFHEHGMALSPDGKDIFYVAADARFSRYVIMHSQLSAGEWTEPRVASFSGKEIDLSPAFSPDGKRLYFASKRPLTTPAGPKNDFDIWYVERTVDGWSAPLNPGGPVNTEKNEVNPAFMSDGTLVFQALEKLGSLAWDIYIAEWKNGAYAPPEKMPPPVNTEFNESGPFIAPDGSYILFNSNRPHGLGIMSMFVSFRSSAGGWSEPVNLKGKLGSPDRCGDFGPVVSPNGRFLFFSSFRNSEPIEPKSVKHSEEMKKLLGSPVAGKGTLYWIDAKIIDDYRPKGSWKR